MLDVRGLGSAFGCTQKLSLVNFWILQFQRLRGVIYQMLYYSSKHFRLKIYLHLISWKNLQGNIPCSSFSGSCCSVSELYSIFGYSICNHDSYFCKYFFLQFACFSTPAGCSLCAMSCVFPSFRSSTSPLVETLLSLTGFELSF